MSAPSSTVRVPGGASSRRRRDQQRWVVAIATTAAVAALFSPAAPTGLAVVDALWCAAFAAVLTFAAARGRRWTGMWLAGIPLVVATGWVLVPAGIALVLALVSIASDQRSRLLGALIGALAAQSLLRMPSMDSTLLQTLVIGVAVAPVCWSGYDNAHGGARRATRWAVGVGAGLLLVAGLGLAVAGLLARQDLQDGVDQARTALDRLGEGEQADATEGFDAAARSFASGADALSAPWTWPARVVPGLAPNREAALDLAEAGGDVASSAAATASTAPYQDLKSEGGQIDLAVVASMQAPLDRSIEVLHAAQGRTAAIDSPWLVPPIADAIDDLDAELVDAIPDAELASQGLAVAPALLGGDGARTYLVLFTTPSETRFLGGFSGAYGLLTADGGTLDLIESGNISELRSAADTVGEIEGFDEFETRYSRYSVTEFFQNLTVSPDFPTDAQVAMQVAAPVVERELHGVIAADPVALAAFLELTGPVEVGDIGRLNADNAADYLLEEQYLRFADDNDMRRDLLGDAATATFDALTSRDLPGPRAVADALAPPVDQERLLFWVPDPEEQAFLGELDLLGGFDPTAGGGDFLSVRNANANPNKIDAFLRREISYEVGFDPSTGGLEATATVVLHNDAPPDGLSDYVIGNRRGEPRGSNTTMLGLYTPHQVEAATVDGRPLALEPQRERGTKVYSALVVVPPGGSVTVRYHLTGVLPAGADYRLDLSNQPLAHDDEVQVSVRDPRAVHRVAEATGLEVDGADASMSGTVRTDRTFTATFEAR
jgi:hypothetical protein